MKNVLRLLAINAIVAAFAVSAVAQTTTTTTAASPAQADAAKVCTDLYTKWRETYKGNAEQQKAAYEAGKEYLAKCPTDEYRSYVEKWVPKYEAAMQGVELDKQLRDAAAAKNWKNVIAVGKQISAKDAENLGILLTIASAGTQGMAGKDGDMSLGPDATSAARRAIQLIESGKADSYTPEQWKAFNFKNKDAALAWLNYAIGFFNINSAPAEAASYFVKAAQAPDSDLRRDPTTYYYLASAYQKAEYAPLVTDYQANCAGKDLTDECKMKLDKMNLVVDRIIDAYARAVASANDPKFAASKTEWMKTLTDLYKFRHEDKTDGLNELIANIQSKPLLLPSMQTMPTPAPATTSPSTTTTPSGTASTSGTTATTPAPAGTTTAKPADANAPKPAPKANASNGVKP